MANRDRMGETTSSLICGLATMNNLTYLLRRGIIHFFPALVRPELSRPACRPLDAAALARPAAVVRHRRHVLDPGHLQPGGGERADRGLAARAGSLHEDVHLLQPMLLRGARGLLGGELRRERRRLAGAFEA